MLAATVGRCVRKERRVAAVGIVGGRGKAIRNEGCRGVKQGGEWVETRRR